MNKNKAHKYSKALISAPRLSTGEYSMKDSNGKLKKVHPLEVKYEGMSFGLIKDLYDGEIKQHSALREYVKSNENALISILVDGGYNTPNIDLKDLVSDISTLLIIKPHINYEMLKFDDKGYVVGSVDLDGLIIAKREKPDDFNKGYYKYIDNKWVVDEERYRQYWSVI